MAIFTKTMAATDVIVIEEQMGVTYVSVLCKTDNSGAAGITLLGNGSIGTTTSDGIVLLANESITVQAEGPRPIKDLTITAGASSTAIVVAT